MWLWIANPSWRECGCKCGDSDKIANFTKFIARPFETIVKTLIL